MTPSPSEPNQAPKHARKRSCGCPENRPRVFPKNHWLGLTGGIVPGTLLALLPKCPVCLAAYLGLLSGFGVSITTARVLQVALAALSVGFLILWITMLARCRRAPARSFEQS